MTLLDDILEWTQTRPLWQQDAARRLFAKPEGLDGDDCDDLYALLKMAHGLPGRPGLEPVPLAKRHLPAGREAQARDSHGADDRSVRGHPEHPTLFQM